MRAVKYTVFFTLFFPVINKTIAGPCVHMPLWIDELHNDPWDSRAQPCVLNDSLDGCSTEESRASFVTLQHFSFFINKMG